MPAVAKLLRTDEVCARLGVHRSTLLKFVNAGRVPVLRVGAVNRFDADAVDAAVRSGAFATPRRRAVRR